MAEGLRIHALRISDKLVRDMPSFSEYLRSWREQRGLTKSELARLLAVSPTHVGNLEKDLSPSSKTGAAPQISRDMCDQIARVLQRPRHEVYLAAYAPELLDEHAHDVRTRRLLAIFEELGEDRQDEVIAYLEMLWRRDVAQPPTEPRPKK